MNHAFMVALLVSGAVGCSARSPVDEAPPPDEYPTKAKSSKPASLVRRLAEAADGYRDGRPKWVVADRQRRDGNHRVVGVFSSSDVADSVAKAAGTTYGAFGPYLTPREGFDFLSNESVAEVIVVYRNGDSTSYSADSVDALFWSLPAFDKFVVPYLASVYSVDYAKRQRDLYVAGRSPFANSEQVVHKKGSF